MKCELEISSGCLSCSFILVIWVIKFVESCIWCVQSTAAPPAQRGFQQGRGLSKLGTQGVAASSPSAEEPAAGAKSLLFSALGDVWGKTTFLSKGSIRNSTGFRMFCLGFLYVDATPRGKKKGPLFLGAKL